MLETRTADSRQIATFNGSSGVDFTSSGLGTTLVGQLQSPAGAGNGAQVLAYLRGDRSQETTSLRRRLQLLGPIIHSEPVLVREPDRSYTDAGYASFRSSSTGRTRMLYVGANDGMMHAFDASTGVEKWAYVPKAVFPRLPGLASPSGLFEATVDGYLTEGDVDFGFTGGTRGSADWRTLLVGGLGRGGKGFYALDITLPPK
jgi:type IV pilus assembly protein PilY1